MIYRILSIFWLLLIFVSSSIPSYDFPEVSFWGWAKLIHLMYFGVLCFLLHNVLRRQARFPVLSKNALPLAIVLATVYGMTDEFHQLFTPGRHGHLTDVFVDALGASLYVAGTAVYHVYQQRRANAA